MNQSKFLPIGTICTIKNGIKVMIAGYKFSDFENDFKICDYLAVEYPVGLNYLNKNFMFNHNDIEQIIFKGYEDNSYESINNKLNGNTKKEEPETINPNLWNVFKNLEFDETGTVVKAERNEDIEIEEIVEAPKFEFDENGIVIAVNNEQKTKTGNIELTSNEKYQFDENGVVTSVNYDNNLEKSLNSNTREEYNSNQENAVNHNLTLNEENKYVFDDNGVVIAVNNETSIEPNNKYVFDDNGVVTAVNNQVPTDENNKYVFDDSGVVVAVNKDQADSKYQFDENGTVIAVNSVY